VAVLGNGVTLCLPEGSAPSPAREEIKEVPHGSC
jgi:hypothetical protein